MRIVLPVIIAAALAIYALIDCGQTDRDRVRSLTKSLWLLVILIPIIGPVAWLLLGRPARTAPGGPRPAPRQRPLAPDDDPEFLRQIRNLDDEHKEMLRDWEDSLRKREQDLRGQKDSPEAPSDRDGDPAASRDEADRRNGGEIDPTDGDTR